MEGALQLIWSGAPADAVLEYLRATCSTTAGISSCITRIRKRAMKELGRPVEAAAMAPYAAEEGVAAFLSMSLEDMVRTQRAHRSDPTWSEPAEAALRSLKLLPPNLEGLRLSPRELLALKRSAEASLLDKQRTVLHVDGEWIRHAIAMAQTCTVHHTYPEIVLPLLLLTGRRTTEVLNGQSTFSPTARGTVARFAGQIKKKGTGAPYDIPLLCDFETLRHAMGVLRDKQSNRVLDAVTCNNLYQKELNGAAPRIFPFVKNVHQLRGVYIASVFRLYQCDVTFNLVAMRALGHTKLSDSLHYNCEVVHGLPEDAFGPLP